MDRNTVYFKTIRGEKGMQGTGNIEYFVTLQKSEKDSPKTKKDYKEKKQNTILGLSPNTQVIIRKINEF